MVGGSAVPCILGCHGRFPFLQVLRDLSGLSVDFSSGLVCSCCFGRSRVCLTLDIDNLTLGIRMQRYGGSALHARGIVSHQLLNLVVAAEILLRYLSPGSRQNSFHGWIAFRSPDENVMCVLPYLVLAYSRSVLTCITYLILTKVLDIWVALHSCPSLAYV